MGKIEKGEVLTEQVNARIDQLQDQLSQGRSEAFLETLAFYSRFWKYSLGNSILIAMQSPNASLVAGYRKCQELSFRVMQGEKDLYIRARWLGNPT